jgi:hypothetical protein
MTAIASEPIRLGTYRAAWNRVAVHEDGVRSDDAVVNRTRAVTLGGRVRALGLGEDLDLSLSMWSWSRLIDGVMLHGVVWSIPFAVAPATGAWLVLNGRKAPMLVVVFGLVCRGGCYSK